MEKFLDCSFLQGDCCNHCIEDEWGGNADMSYKLVETKYGKVGFTYCCRHSFVYEEDKLKNLIENELNKNIDIY